MSPAKPGMQALCMLVLTCGLKAKAGSLDLRDRLGLAEQTLFVIAGSESVPDLLLPVIGFLEDVQAGNLVNAGDTLLQALDAMLDDAGIEKYEKALGPTLPKTYRYHRPAEPGPDGLFDWQRRKGAGFGDD